MGTMYTDYYLIRHTMYQVKGNTCLASADVLDDLLGESHCGLVPYATGHSQNHSVHRIQAVKATAYVYGCQVIDVCPS